MRLLAQRSSLQVFFDRVRLGVFDMQGQALAFDPANPPPEQPEAILRTTQTGEPAYANWLAPNLAPEKSTQTPNRTFAMPIPAGEVGAPGVILWIATSDEYADQLVRSVRLSVILTVIAGMLGTAIAGWLIAGIAVRPLQQIHSAVRSLSPGHTSMEASDDDEEPEVTRLRAELDSAVERIEAGYAAYSRFIANVSHELKTPIAVALTESQVLLEESTIDEKSRHFAESIAEEMARLGRLIESFLTLTRVREGKLEKGVRDYPVNDLVMDSVEHCWDFAQQHGATLSPTLLESEGGMQVCVDPDLMRTAVDNLIRNAIRFTSAPGRVEILVGQSEDERYALISVRDYGPGIPEDVLPVLFDRFAQAQSEIRAGRGTGLGLEIALGIAEIHDGSITVRNLETGCMFEIEIPLVAESDECEPT